MTSTLLRCIMYFAQLPNKRLYNLNTKTTNFVIQWYRVPLVLITRNANSQSQIYTKQSLLLTAEKFLNLKIITSTQGWIPKSSLENVLNGISTADDIGSYRAFLLLEWCNNIMDCLPKERLIFGKYLWSHLQICNVQMDVTHYNALLQIYLSNDYDFSPKELLEEMINENIDPNINTYEKCIEYYCRKGNIEEALEIVKHMEKSDLSVTEAVRSSLILGYSQVGDFDSINHILNGLEGSSGELSVDMYNAVMCAYAKVNNIAKIKELIHVYNSNKISLSNRIIIHVIYTLAVNKHMEHINTMYTYLKESSLYSNDEFLLLLKLINNNQIDVVMNILLRIRNVQFMNLILQNLINHDTNLTKIVAICQSLKKEKMCEKPLLLALYYSFFHNNDDQCFHLLEICRLYHTIKPHFFWPLLIRKAQKYDYKGILGILRAMINKFHVLPCIDTIANYVIPYSFEKVYELRSKLIKLGIHYIIIDNAMILSFLKIHKLPQAVHYMNKYPSCYYYKVLGQNVRSSFILNNDVNSFLYISKNLKKCKYINIEALSTNDKSTIEPVVPIKTQLMDLMDDYPFHVRQLQYLIFHLKAEGMRIPREVVKRIKDMERSSNRESKKSEESSNQESTGSEESSNQESTGSEESSNQESTGSEESSNQSEHGDKSQIKCANFIKEY
ncbi:bicoid stability factor [Calliopsis andreniformis]|uniref:bicoid stability factor n=1 Tax=Calliopsis andreniformis TaxID=337506 RepID=UPI003FCD61DB